MALERDLAERVQLWLLVAETNLVWVQGLGSGVRDQGLGFGVEDLGVEIQDLGFGV